MAAIEVPGASFAPEPHEQVRRYFAGVRQTETWRDGDVAALRRETRHAALQVRGDLEPVEAVETIALDGLECRLYLPARQPSGAARTGGVLWVHGGGWVHGDLDSYEGVARAMAASTARPVLAVDYRLAPEHPYPAGLDDVLTAYRWLSARSGPVVMAGDSSGANLVAGAAIKARDLGLPLAAQILIYPVLDSADTPFKRAFRDRYAGFAGQPDFGQDTYHRIRHIWRQYLADPAARAEPYAVPSRARSLRGVAPAVLVTAEHDILRGEAEDYVARLRADGVPVALHEFPGQIHGFFQMRGVMSDAHRGMDLVAAAIRDALSVAGST